MVINPEIDDLIYSNKLFQNNTYPIEMTLPLIFIAMTLLMTAIGNGVAKTFALFSPLKAYRLDIIGSLLGIVTFSLFSFLALPPIAWGITISIVFILLMLSERMTILSLLQIIALFGLMHSFMQESKAPYHWSPYYKISLEPYSHGRVAVLANGMPQQFIESVEQRKVYKPFYFLPYKNRVNKTLNNVLVIGAGTGGDVAIALANGAKHIDALEIDPTLYRLGRTNHPDKPYFDKRVSVHINDGRVFLQNTKRQYDMIIYALPDSLMVISGQSSIRLENYLFTVEAITRAKQLLTKTGTINFYNYYHERWIIDRLANTLALVFGNNPCFDTEGPDNIWLSVLSISKNPANLSCATKWSPHFNREFATPITDDHPFFYLKSHQIDPLYIAILSFVSFISLLGLKLTGAANRRLLRFTDLFLLGAAFLLLETKSIGQFALLFGSTWIVNAFVFAGVLLSVYLAIEVTSINKAINKLFLFTLLLASLAVLWIVPNSLLLSLPFLPRLVAACTLAGLPIFIANLIFANRFKETDRSVDAFAANLLGAVAGGLVEYSSLLIGYRDLLIVIGAFYLLAMLINLMMGFRYRFALTHH